MPPFYHPFYQLSAAAGISLGTLLLSASPVGAQQPSFDCAKAGTPVERAICGSSTLSRLDVQLAQSYIARRAKLDKKGRSRLLAEQRDWLIGRDRCGPSVKCIETAIRSRMAAVGNSGTAPARSSASHLGRWKPYSKTAVFYGEATLSKDRLAYDDGLAFDLKQVRPGSNVYRIMRVHGQDPGPCGNRSATHMAFIIHDGLLQLHEFNRSSDPSDPPPMTSQNMASGPSGLCSVSFYSR